MGELLDCIYRLRPATHVSALDFSHFEERVLECQESLRNRIEDMEVLICAHAARSSQLVQERSDSDICKGNMPQQLQSHDRGAPVLCKTRSIDLQMLNRLAWTSSSEIMDELQR